MREEILQKLIEKTAKVVGKEPSELNENTNIKTDLDVRSIELVGIISELEEEYDCFIKYTELMHANTIGESADIIAKMVE